MASTLGETLPASFGSYNVDKFIGEGSFGIVFMVNLKEGQGTEMEERIHYALKVIDTKDSNEKLKSMAENERQLLQSVNHINIVLYKESFYVETKLCLAMEYCSGGTLYALMRARGEGLPEKTFINYLRQISEGTKYLHNKDIIHRDLKSKNLLLKDETHSTIKIADFGVARVFKDGAPTKNLTKFVGTVHFMSPEMMETNNYTNKTDIWSIGCTCVEMGTTRYAFDGENIPQIRELVNNVKVLNFDKVTYSDGIKKMILGMLRKKPDERPSLDTILEVLVRQNARHQETGNSQRSISDTAEPLNRRLSRSRPSSENETANERERLKQNKELLERQSAHLQGAIVAEIEQQNATETVTTIKGLYREKRLENAEDETLKLLGREIFARLKFLFRALSSLEDGINEFKRKLGETTEDTS